MPETGSKTKAIFADALEFESPAERNTYVKGVCGDDTDLRREVESLLAAHFQADGFLSQATSELNPTISVAAKPNILDTQIGPYKLREKIGEGGMGEVYVAEQTEPVRRKVALKIIKPGMASKDVVARFEAERQALAMMDHPNIASVLDGGAAEAGQPFFVMELVRGVPITEYCDRERLSTTERLQLFIKVCRAVQHAHQKGIIHRDIKPTNVLVPEIDGEAVPKVIDFGVAKAVSQKLTDQTVYTKFEQVVGTPLYMSPEQAGTGAVDIDTRSDVYSLGVLLYELLTGNTPFDRETLKQSGFDEFRRILREEEPRRPSQAIDTLNAEAISTISDRRACDPRRLMQTVRGELDWIVMKTLEKDRSRRYETANGMARDIERYLSSEPVEACPPSTAYRFRKFAKRNRGRLVASLLATTFLLAGLTLVVGMKLQRDRARNQLTDDIQQSLAAARASVESNNLAAANQRAAEMQGLLTSWHEDLPQLVASVAELEAEVEERSRQQRQFQEFQRLAQLAMKDISRGMSRNKKSESRAIEALASYGVLSESDWRQRLTNSYLIRQQQQDVKEFSYELLLTLADSGVRYKSTTEDSAQRSLVYLELAESFHRPTRGLYWIRAECHRFLKADQAAEEAMVRFESTTATTALDYYLPGQTAGRKGDREAAIRDYEQALLIEPDHFMSLFFLAYRLGQEERMAESSQVYRACLAVRPDDYPTLMNLANYLSDEGQFADASKLLDRALKVGKEKHRSQVLCAQASILEKQGKYQEAISLLNCAIETSPSSLVIAHTNLGHLYLKQGDLDKAISEFDRAIDIDPNHTQPHVNRAEALRRQGDLDGAIDGLTEALQVLERSPQVLSARGMLRRATGQYDEALADFNLAIKLDSEFAFAYFQRAGVHVERGDYTTALADLNRAVQIAPSAKHYTYRGLVNRQLRNYAQALADYERAIEMAPNHAAAYNAASWLRTTCSDPNYRDTTEALRYAERAVELSPDDGNMWNTLAYAQFRSKKYQLVLESCHKALGCRAGVGHDFYLLAMAHWKLGDQQQARQWRRKAKTWQSKQGAADNDLARLRAEADRLIEKPSRPHEPDSSKGKSSEPDTQNNQE